MTTILLKEHRYSILNRVVQVDIGVIQKSTATKTAKTQKEHVHKIHHTPFEGEENSI